MSVAGGVKRASRAEVAPGHDSSMGMQVFTMGKDISAAARTEKKEKFMGKNQARIYYSMFGALLSCGDTSLAVLMNEEALALDITRSHLGAAPSVLLPCAVISSWLAPRVRGA
jgi:hypothetical protein